MLHLLIIIIEKHPAHNNNGAKQDSSNYKDGKEASNDRLMPRAALVKVEFDRMPEHIDPPNMLFELIQ